MDDDSDDDNEGAPAAKGKRDEGEDEEDEEMDAEGSHTWGISHGKLHAASTALRLLSLFAVALSVGAGWSVSGWSVRVCLVNRAITEA